VAAGLAQLKYYWGLPYLIDLHKISLGDLQLLADLPRFHSLRSWAAKNKMTPIAATRVIKRIEDALDTVIIHRSALGFTMTSAGDALIKKSLELLQAASGLSAVGGQDPSAGFKPRVSQCCPGWADW
jgi:DNA-binding transcriptional LysR family regulator